MVQRSTEILFYFLDFFKDTFSWLVFKERREVKVQDDPDFINYNVLINLANASLPSGVHLYTPASSRTFVNT